jgi:hypothetical protein
VAGTLQVRQDLDCGGWQRKHSSQLYPVFEPGAVVLCREGHWSPVLSTLTGDESKSDALASELGIYCSTHIGVCSTPIGPGLTRHALHFEALRTSLQVNLGPPHSPADGELRNLRSPSARSLWRQREHSRSALFRSLILQIVECSGDGTSATASYEADAIRASASPMLVNSLAFLR